MATLETSYPFTLEQFSDFVFDASLDWLDFTEFTWAEDVDGNVELLYTSALSCVDILKGIQTYTTDDGTYNLNIGSPLYELVYDPMPDCVDTTTDAYVFVFPDDFCFTPGSDPVAERDHPDVISYVVPVAILGDEATWEVFDEGDYPAVTPGIILVILLDDTTYFARRLLFEGL